MKQKLAQKHVVSKVAFDVNAAKLEDIPTTPSITRSLFDELLDKFATAELDDDESDENEGMMLFLHRTWANH